MRVSCKTDTGKKREHNEDSILVDAKNGVFLLADGMGGHKAGEMASRMAVEVAYDHLISAFNAQSNPQDIPDLLKEALTKAHEAIKTSEKIGDEFRGMGTTLVIFVVRDNKAYICHVGDSRAYYIGKNIRQITKDQTLGNQMSEVENKRPEEIPNKAWHTLTQAVGVSKNIVPDLNNIELQPGDVIILCSDGLSGMLEDQEIEEIVHKNDFNNVADILVQEANNKGGKDNISVVAVRYPGADDAFWRLKIGD